MSWQKIFNTARRFGTPVIVTDQEGIDPMVILPFDIYEGLISETGAADVHQTRYKSKKVMDRRAEPDVLTESVLEIPYEDMENQKKGSMEPFDGQNILKKSQDSSEEPMDSLEGGISLEERFYFEPMEDDLKK